MADDRSAPANHFDIEILTSAITKRLDGHGDDIRAIWNEMKAIHVFCVELMKEQNAGNNKLLEKIHDLETVVEVFKMNDSQVKMIRDEHSLIKMRLDKVEKKANRAAYPEAPKANKVAKYIGIGSAISGLFYGAKWAYCYLKGLPPPPPPTTPLF